MENPLVARLRSQREAWQTELDGLVRQAVDQGRQELSDSETRRVTEIREALGPLDERLKQLADDERARARYLEQAAVFDRSGEIQRAYHERGGTWSDRVLQSGITRSFDRGTSAPVEVGSVFEGGRTLARSAAPAPLDSVAPPPITSDSLGGLEVVQTVPQVVGLPEPPSILGLLPRAGTTARLIQYVQETGTAGQAAITPEGAPKPQLGLSFEARTAEVLTVAGWVIASRQVLDDLPMLRTFIDSRLRAAVLRAVETFVLAGDTQSGTAGILAGAQAVAGANLFDAVLSALEAVQGAGYAPGVAVVNPTDWFGLLRSLVGSAGADSGPLADTVLTGGLTRELAGLPVVVSPAIVQGSVLVGDFASGAQLWDRQQTQVLIADQHADLFIRNTLVLLAECRLALTVYAPGAFASATIGSVTPGNGGGTRSTTSSK